MSHNNAFLGTARSKGAGKTQVERLRERTVIVNHHSHIVRTPAIESAPCRTMVARTCTTTVSEIAKNLEIYALQRIAKHEYASPRDVTDSPHETCSNGTLARTSLFSVLPRRTPSRDLRRILYVA